MKKTITLLLIFVFCSLIFAGNTLAFENPIGTSNNRFGIHVIDEHDLTDAAALVNSSGGDWGYVTIVIQENDLVNSKWQKVFNQMKELHLIPLVRIASSPEGETWKKLDSNKIPDWVDFLNSLEWPTKNRYLIVGNEVNHAKEWGGDIDPKEYAGYYKEFAVRLKLTSSDFFVMPAGLDASAPNSKGYMSEDKYLTEVITTDPTVIDYIDGLASHSYPNPGFRGAVTDTGRGSVRTYEWELEILKQLGVNKDIPVFITETGWVNSSGNITEKLTYAYQNVWNDARIVAVTPFLLNYQGYPFADFSWKAKDGTFYPHYQEIASLPKVKGEPIMVAKEIKKIDPIILPPKYEVASILFGISTTSNSYSQSYFTSQ